MYPYNFRPEGFFVDPMKAFIAMPFATEYRPIYDDLILPAMKKANEALGENEKLQPWRADDPTYTRSGWVTILENLYTARIVLGVLTGNNPNVFYELGIAHATQQIERQVLVAEKGYSPKFDLKDLIYREYDPKNLRASINDLANGIVDTLRIFDINNDRQVSLAESKLSMSEVEVIVTCGGQSHFHLLDGADPKLYDGLTYLCHSGLLRCSTEPHPEEAKIALSFYWTPLGNAVLRRLQIIKEETLKKRNANYRGTFGTW